MSLRVVLTAGFDGALPVVALAELLRRDGVVIAGLLVVSPYQLGRLRRLLRQRGFRYLKPAAQRLLGCGPGASAGNGRPDALTEFLIEQGIGDRSLARWARRHGIPYHRVRSLNHPDALAAVRASAAEGVAVDNDGNVYGAEVGPRALRKHLLPGGVVRDDDN